MKDIFDTPIHIGDVVMMFTSKGVDGYGKVCKADDFSIEIFQGFSKWNNSSYWRTKRKRSSYLVLILEGNQFSYVVNNMYPFKLSYGSTVTYEDQFQQYLITPDKVPDDF